jgi:hypothetical protein
LIALAGSLRPSDPRLDLVRKRLEELAPRVPRVTLIAAERLPAGLVVRTGDLAIAEGAFCVPIPLDPGPHVVSVTAPGYGELRYHLDLPEGQVRTIPVVAPPPLAPVDDARSRRPRAANVVDESRTSDGSTWRWGVVSFGAAGAAVAIGAVTGIGALNSKRTMDAHCDPDGCSDPGLDAARRGRALSSASTVSFFVGAAFAGLGTALVLLGRPGTSIGSLRAELSPVSVRLSGEL